MSLDPELIELGQLALRNEFYREYSALVSRYVAATQDDNFRYTDIVSMSNPASTDDDLPFEHLSIEVQTPYKFRGFKTIEEALATKGDSISLNGRKIFIWERGRAGEGWYWQDAD